MIISTGKKSEFVPFVAVANDVWDVRWGKEDVVEKVGKIDEATGEWVLTGEVKETSLCTYATHRFFKALPTAYQISRLIEQSKRVPAMGELKVIGEALELGEEALLNWMKGELKKAIVVYDGSSAVNGFTVGGVQLWLDKATRVGLKLRFESELASGKTDTVLWQDGMSFPLKLEDAIKMLAAIELYASACYDNTQAQLAACDELESVDAVLAFDYKSGYPAQLAF